MSGALRFDVTDDIDAVLEDRWWSWASSATPFAVPSFFAAWRTAFARDRRAFAVVGSIARSPVFVLPMWHATDRPDEWCSLGEFRADYTQASGSDLESACPAFWRWLELEAPCRSARISLIPDNDPLARSAPTASPRRRDRLRDVALNLLRSGRPRYHVTAPRREHQRASAAHVTTLAKRLDSAETRRKLNVLRRLGAVEYTVIREPREIAARLPAFFEMHVASFADTGRTSQFVRAEERVFYEQLATHPRLAGIVHLDLLSVGERPAAMHLGFERNAWIYWYKPAFDRELVKGSPGRVLLAHLFARAAREGRGVDLLKGTEDYKLDWADAPQPTVSATVLELSARSALGMTLSKLRRGPRP